MSGLDSLATRINREMRNFPDGRDAFDKMYRDVMKAHYEVMEKQSTEFLQNLKRECLESLGMLLIGVRLPMIKEEYNLMIAKIDGVLDTRHESE